MVVYSNCQTTKTTRKMNYLQFDRHQLFKDVKNESGLNLLDLTMDLKREISDYCFDNNIDDHSFENLISENYMKLLR